MCSHVICTPPMHKLTWGRVEYCTGQVQSLRVILSVLGSSDMSTFSIHTAFCTNLTLKNTVRVPSVVHLHVHVRADRTCVLREPRRLTLSDSKTK